MCVFTLDYMRTSIDWSSSLLFHLLINFGVFQYLDNVVGAGSPKYDQGYFEVNYLQAYTTGLPAPSPTAVVNGVGLNRLLLQQSSGISSNFQLQQLSLGVISMLLLVGSLL